MHKHALLLLICLASFYPLMSQNLAWTSAVEPWPESFGSQRAVIEITTPADCIELDLPWRRHDRSPDRHQFLVVEAANGDTIKNINRLEVNAEHCHIQFGPVKTAGLYYFYYLPFTPVEGWGYYSKDYLMPESPGDPLWIGKTRNDKPGIARILRIECRTDFDSFYPMEIIPTKREKTAFLKHHSDSVLLFTESRENPIRMKDEIPLKWIQQGPSAHFTGQALRNEYYAFQVGVYPAKIDIKQLDVIAGSLQLSGHPGSPAIPLTCFNTQGMDPYGKSFTRQLDIPLGKVQALWIGADIPENALPGKYTGNLTIIGNNISSRQIAVTLIVSGQLLADRGDSEPWRHSRLRWLNSTAGSEGSPVQPYLPIELTDKNHLQVAGHDLALSESGLPLTILHKNAELLSSSVDFILETKEGRVTFPACSPHQENHGGSYIQSASTQSGNLQAHSAVRVDYDGYIKTIVTIKNRSSIDPVDFEDIRLEIPLAADKAKYIMGMGLPGCAVTSDVESKWNGPADSFWIGAADIGIWCELRGSTYHGPLLNLYHPAPPESWHNSGKGGFRITRNPNQVTAQVYSGSRQLNPGDSIQFEWAMLLTPVKDLNTASQFTDRYYHNGGKPVPTPEDFDAGVKIVNVHHANKYNPYINYPFIATDEMRSFVDSLHALDKKVKIYYTVRELTNHVTEVWALRSLGYEILDKGNGGGYPWLREHFIDGYTPQWYQHFPDGRVDASVLSAPGDSRWLNYYIEGLAWLVKNEHIDGLYLDDVTFDRPILQRMRSVMNQVKPGCIIDLHSNTGFSKGPAIQYAGFFPYIDKLWFGESFQYDKMSPENWLVEVSGIPFGLMGDMLQGGGNRWLGMVFGMTVRYPWTTEGVLCDPKPVWKIWDEFQIQDAKMIGFWDQACPIQTGTPEVKATAYVKTGKTLIALGNFSDQEKTVNLTIDWKTLGIDSLHCQMEAPEIEHFQKKIVLSPNDSIKIEPRQGLLIYLNVKHLVP